MSKYFTLKTFSRGGQNCRFLYIKTISGDRFCSDIEQQTKNLVTVQGKVEDQAKDLVTVQGKVEDHAKDLVTVQGKVEDQAKDLVTVQGKVEDQAKVTNENSQALREAEK